jgi:very-short-patch-repair endonuclease
MMATRAEISLPLKGGGSGRGSAKSRFSRTRAKTQAARRLRVQTTAAEKALWQILRSAQIGGLAFRRQHPLGDYVLDFYCPAIRLAVEVDGGQHNQAPGREHDLRRMQWLRSKGVNVLRFWNNDVLVNLQGVATEIARVAGALRAGSATPTLTLPLSGGGNEGSLDIVFGEVDR